MGVVGVWSWVHKVLGVGLGVFGSGLGVTCLVGGVFAASPESGDELFSKSPSSSTIRDSSSGPQISLRDTFEDIFQIHFQDTLNVVIRHVFPVLLPAFRPLCVVVGQNGRSVFRQVENPLEFSDARLGLERESRRRAHAMGVVLGLLLCWLFLGSNQSVQAPSPQP